MTTRRTRTTGLGRILATGLIFSALLAAFPAPAQAAPVGRDGASLAGLLDWLEGFLAGLGFSGGSEDGPEAAFLPDSSSLDPVGGNAEVVQASDPVARSVGSGVSERSKTK